MERDYYEKFYAYERNHWYFINRSRIIKNNLQRFVNTQNPLRILNVGVATGATSEMLALFGEVVSVEYDKECAEFASKVLNKKVHNNSVTELPFKDSTFDLVCAFDVIEHVDDHRTAIMEMNRVCKSGGNIYLTVPAFMSLWSDHDVINHHKRRYRLREIQNLFESHRGQELYVGYFNSLLFLPIFIVRQLINFSSNRRNTRDKRSDFEVLKGGTAFGKIINTILGFIFSLEVPYLKHFRFPFGVSLMFLWKKE